MAVRLEIRLRPKIRDPEGELVASKARSYFGIQVEGIRVVRVLTIDKEFSQEQLELIQHKIFTNPVTEISQFKPISVDFDQLIWVGLKPGVRDNQGSTAVEAIQDLLRVQFSPDEGIYFSKIYEVKGRLTKADAEVIAKELLANELIQQWKVYSREEWDPQMGIGLIIPKVIIPKEPGFEFIPIDSDETLLRISFERNLALHPKDVPVIRAYFLREDVIKERERFGLHLPTDVELEYISQARSDHCNHNTFRGLFRYKDLATGQTLIVDNLFRTCIEEPTLKIQKEKDWVISVLWDNAGVAKFDQDYYYTITGETHNSPSNMEAYGGAITGIVGVYRDPMGTGKGSRLIMGMYGFCVGPRDYKGELRPHLHPRRILDGVIEGVRDGGNKHGVPTPYGFLLFDESYIGKCLVYVTALGIMPSHIKDEPSHLKTTSHGDLIIMCGGRVGKDGIHGVTAASEVYSEHTPAGHVQIGDPYTQKKMHDFLLEARDRGLIRFITDNGGGGLSSSIGESARFSNGARVELDKVPLKYQGLDCWEIWVSESQERMTVAIRPDDLEAFMELSRLHGVESTVIGRFNNSGYLKLEYKGKTCAYIRMDLLRSHFPQWEFEAEWIPPELRGLSEPVVTEPEDLNKLLLNMLRRPNICCRNWIQRQYDHEVQGGSVIKPLVGVESDIPSDAVVIRPVLGRDRGIAVAQAINPFFSKIDTYHMVANVIDEAVRKVIAVGGNPEEIGGIDNFCWPTVQYDPSTNPDGKYKAAQLVRANWALRDYCLAYGIPLLSGKDSMYIDGNLPGPYGERRKVSGLPAMLFTASTTVRDVKNCVTLDPKFPGDLVYVLGITSDELAGSEYYQLLGYTGLNIPKIDPSKLLIYYRKLAKAMEEGIIASCHAVSRGGLGVHLAFMAMAGLLGMEIDISLIPTHKSLPPSKVLFSESGGRFIVTISKDNREPFERLMEGMPFGLIGHVTDGNEMILKLGEEIVLNLEIRAMKKAWYEPFGGLI